MRRKSTGTALFIFEMSICSELVVDSERALQPRQDDPVPWLGTDGNDVPMHTTKSLLPSTEFDPGFVPNTLFEKTACRFALLMAVSGPSKQGQNDGIRNY